MKRISLLVLLSISLLSLFAVFSLDNQSEVNKQADSTSTGLLTNNSLDSLSYQLLYKDADKPVKALKTPSLGGMLFRMVLSLILITIILYIALRVIKKLNNSNPTFFNRNMKIIDTINIGFKQSIYIVSIMDKIYLFSVSANGVSLIEKVENAEQLEKLIYPNQANSDSFDKILEKLKIKKNKG